MTDKENEVLNLELKKIQDELEKERNLVKTYSERIKNKSSKILELEKQEEFLSLKLQKEEVSKLYKYCQKNNLTADELIEILETEQEETESEI